MVQGNYDLKNRYNTVLQILYEKGDFPMLVGTHNCHEVLQCHHGSSLVKPNILQSKD